MVVESEPFVDRNWSPPFGFRTTTINNRLESLGLSREAFLQQSLYDRLEILSPTPEDLDRLREQGKFSVIFPAEARIYRILGRMPKAEEILYEFNNLALIGTDKIDDVREWLAYEEVFFDLLRPMVEEYALARWRMEKARSQDTDPYELINEAYLIMREKLIFNFDWQRDSSNITNYLMSTLKGWLIGFSLWRNEPQTDRFGNDVEEIKEAYRFGSPSYQEGVLITEEADRVAEEAKELLNNVREKLSSEEQEMFDCLLLRSQIRPDLSKRQYEKLRKKTLISIARSLGLETAADINFGKRKIQYQRHTPGRSKSPFIIENKTVFDDLSLEEAYQVISLLPIEEQYLVLFALGYFSDKSKEEIARELGRKTPVFFSYLDLRNKLIQARKKHNKEEWKGQDNTLRNLLTGINMALENGALHEVFRKRAARKKSLLREQVDEIDLGDQVNQQIYLQRLNEKQRRILDLILQRNEQGILAYSITDIARLLKKERQDLRVRIKEILRIFRDKELVRPTKLRKRAELLAKNKLFERLVQAVLTPLQQQVIRLYLGLPTADQETALLHDIFGIARLLGKDSPNIHRIITTALSTIEGTINEVQGQVVGDQSPI